MSSDLIQRINETTYRLCEQSVQSSADQERWQNYVLWLPHYLKNHGLQYCLTEENLSLIMQELRSYSTDRKGNLSKHVQRAWMIINDVASKSETFVSFINDQDKFYDAYYKEFGHSDDYKTMLFLEEKNEALIELLKTANLPFEIGRRPHIKAGLVVSVNPNLKSSGSHSPQKRIIEIDDPKRTGAMTTMKHEFQHGKDFAFEENVYYARIRGEKLPAKFKFLRNILAFSGHIRKTSGLWYYAKLSEQSARKFATGENDHAKNYLASHVKMLRSYLIVNTLLLSLTAYCKTSFDLKNPFSVVTYMSLAFLTGNYLYTADALDFLQIGQCKLAGEASRLRNNKRFRNIFQPS